MKVKFLLFSIVLITCFTACTKTNQAPAPTVTIVGKWFLTKQATSLSNNGTLISSSQNSTFTSSDFVLYNSDGTGYYSKNTANGPGLKTFNYIIKGTAITEFTGAEVDGIPETVTNLTANNLSLHVVTIVIDPNNPELTDTETDDFYYAKTL